MGEPSDTGERAPADQVAHGDWDTAARVALLLETVQSFARLDFSTQAPVGDAGDDLDGLAAGINMLGEELQAAHHEFELRVATSTAELRASAARLEDEIAERRRAECEIARSNAQLTTMVRRLRWLDAQVARLTHMTNVLQVVEDRAEAFAVLSRLAPEISPGTGGELYVFTAARDSLELAVSWGSSQQVPPTMTPESCHALRDGAVHHVRTPEDPRCGHLPRGGVDRALCIPISVQARPLGLLHLRRSPRSDPEPEASAPGAPDGEYEGSPEDYERLAVAAGEQLALALANLDLRSELRSQSIRDALTGLYNRRHLDESLGRELHRAEREGIAVSVLMVDIDHFKVFNDTYGHAAGDAVLAEVAALLVDGVREQDVVYRYGGEEMAVVMAGVEGVEAARRAEQIRSSIAARPFTWNGEPAGSLTVSIGVAAHPHDARTPSGLFRAADAAMYAAKRNGRDRVEVAPGCRPSD